jgi:hypothetical protein
MGQNFFDGTKVDTNTLIEVVGGKGTDNLAHPFQLDPLGKLYVNVSGIVAGALTAATDSVAIGLAGTALVAEGIFSTSGNNTFIAAVPTKMITVLGYEIQAKNSVSGTVTVKFFDDTPAQILGSPEWDFQAREGVVTMAPSGTFKFQGGVGKAVQVNLSAAQSVMVHVIYTTV